MLPLPTEATAEEEMNTCICKDNFDSHSKTRRNHNHTDGEQETGNLKWEEVIGPLTSATNAANFELCVFMCVHACVRVGVYVYVYVFVALRLL